MIPHFDVELRAELPPEATFWMPEDDDLSEEGVGYFRGTWALGDVAYEEAEEAVRAEAALLSLADELSPDETVFDEVAHALESGYTHDIEHLLTTDALRAQAADLEDTSDSLGGLELGVAGLSHVLTHIGCVTAASCRAHASNSWTDAPVVLFAADRTTAEALSSLVVAAKCGFSIDPNRPDLLAVAADSIQGLMNLARLILDRRDGFRPTLRRPT